MILTSHNRLLDREVRVIERCQTIGDLYDCLSLFFDYHGLWLTNEQASVALSVRFDRAVPLSSSTALRAELLRFGRQLASLRRGRVTQLTELQIEYARLFIGPGHPEICIHESGYLRGDPSVGLTRELMRLYREEGQGVAFDFKEPPDHVSNELAYSGHLYRKQVEAMSSRHSALFSVCARKRRIFLQTHLIRWVPDFTREVERATVVDFYQSFARVTREFVLWDYERNQAGFV